MEIAKSELIAKAEASVPTRSLALRRTLRSGEKIDHFGCHCNGNTQEYVCGFKLAEWDLNCPTEK